MVPLKFRFRYSSEGWSPVFLTGWTPAFAGVANFYKCPEVFGLFLFRISMQAMRKSAWVIIPDCISKINA